MDLDEASTTSSTFVHSRPDARKSFSSSPSVISAENSLDSTDSITKELAKNLASVLKSSDKY